MNACKQQGAALVVGLVVLLVMTMLGISGMSTTTNQLRMANNLQTHQVAFQATEAVAAFFAEGKHPEDDNPFTIDWKSDQPQLISNLDPAGDGSASTDLQVIYVGCNTVAVDQSLTLENQDGTSGTPAPVHDLVIVSSALNASGDPIGQKNNRVNGVQTMVAGCP